MASAGRVLLIPKGNWLSGASYTMLDVVFYGGASYVAKSAVSGTTPPSSDSGHWQILCSGFDLSMITQEIVDDENKVPSSKSVYALKKRPVNNNLLDNSWFTINQRGVTSWENAWSDTYTVDRWKIISAGNVFSGTLSDGIFNITGGTVANIFDISQILGKTVTLSVMLSDGTIKSTTGKVPSTVETTWTELIPSTTNPTVQLWSYSDTSLAFVGLSAGSYKAVKLEIGSESTLANDTAPDYATELLKCQRYLLPLDCIMLLDGYLGDNLYFSVYSNAINNMRTKPSIIVVKPYYVYIKGGANVEGSLTYNVNENNGANRYISIIFNKSNHGITPNDSPRAANGLLLLSAEL